MLDVGGPCMEAFGMINKSCSDFTEGAFEASPRVLPKSAPANQLRRFSVRSCFSEAPSAASVTDSAHGTSGAPEHAHDGCQSVVKSMLASLAQVLPVDSQFT